MHSLIWWTHSSIIIFHDSFWRRTLINKSWPTFWQAFILVGQSLSIARYFFFFASEASCNGKNVEEKLHRYTNIVAFRTPEPRLPSLIVFTLKVKVTFGKFGIQQRNKWVPQLRRKDFWPNLTLVASNLIFIMSRVVSEAFSVCSESEKAKSINFDYCFSYIEFYYF